MRKFNLLCLKLLTVFLFILFVQLSGFAQVLVYPSNDGPGNPYTTNGITSVSGTVNGGLKSAASITATAFVTADNENNTLTGTPDGDLDLWMYNTNSRAPIEFNLFVDDNPVTTAQLSLLVYDIDYAAGERDEVFFNGHSLGYLSGTNDAWSTNSWTINPAWVNPGPAGKNLVKVMIDVTGSGRWAVTVDWGQVNINGGNSTVVVSSAILNKTCFAPCDKVSVDIEVDANPAADVIVETLLVDNNGITVDQNDKAIAASSGVELYTATLSAIDCKTLPGQDYMVKIFVYENLLGAKGVQLAYKEVKVGVCGCGVVKAGPDVMICKGSKTQLEATGAYTYKWTPTTGLSDPNIANPVASPSFTTTYTVTGSFPPVELLTNAGFESGNNGFTSQYTYVPDGTGNTELVPEGTYGVGGNAANYHPSFVGLPHSGTSMMMIVNGATTPNKVVWQQTLSVVPASDFAFSIWCYHLAGGSSNATLQLVVNGVNVGPVFTVSTANWTQMARTWNSGTATSAIVQLIDTNIDAATNDFALDDASFMYNCVSSSTDEVTVFVDLTAPVLNCPKAPTAQCSITEVPPYANFAAFAAAGGTATDTGGMGVDNASFKWVSDVSDNKSCPETVTRTYQIADICGNTTTCTQNIVIWDTKLPTMVLHEICVYLSNEGKWALNVEDKWAISKDITDNCTARKDLIITFSPQSFDCDNATKKNPVVVTATDKCNNTATATVMVTVADTIKPIAKCQNVTTYLDSYGQAYVVQAQVNAAGDNVAPSWAKFFANLHGGSYDNCEVKELHMSRQLFTCNDVGKPAEITFSVVDPSGNVGTCKSVITVMDTLVPVITQAANITMTVAPGVCGTKVAYPEIVTKDNCTTTLVRTAGLGANSNFPVGTTTETWKVTDVGGKSATMSFTVTINTYNAAPAIATVADITVDEDAAKFDVPLTDIGYGIDCIAQQIVSLDVANSNTALLTVTKEYTLGATTGKLVVTPVANKYGVATITLTVKDNGGTANGGVDTTVKTFKITVNSVNDVPTVTPIADQVVILPNSLSVNVVTPFKDIDEGDALTFKVTKSDGSALPSWMTFSTTTGLLTGTPTLANYGTVEIKVVATDKAGATAQDLFNVTVKGEFKIMGKVVRKTGSPDLITQGKDPVSTPAAGVDVVLKQGATVVVSTVTAADGTYSFSVPAGDYGVFVVVTGYTQNVTQNVTVNAANPLKDKVDFTIWTGTNNIITSVKDLNNDFGFKLYPNPTSGKVNIEITWNEMRKVDVSVYNILGMQVFRNQYTPGDLITIDMSDQVTGIYLVKLNAEGQSIVRKLTLDKR